VVESYRVDRAKTTMGLMQAARIDPLPTQFLTHRKDFQVATIDTRRILQALRLLETPHDPDLKI
jgi:hypothetical protein